MTHKHPEADNNVPLPSTEETQRKEDFTFLFTQVAEGCHTTSVSKGFYQDKDGNTYFNEAEKIALMHSELSEALEASRDGDPASVKIPGFSQSEEEYADAVIRIMDTCSFRSLRLAEAILAKADYNKSRPHKHGRKF